MMSLAEGFLDALEADFEHIAPTAFTDGRNVSAPRAERANLKDWTTLKSLSGDFPKIPTSEYGIPRPNSKQRARSAEKNERVVERIRGMSPDGGGTRAQEASLAKSADMWDGDEVDSMLRLSKDKISILADGNQLDDVDEGDGPVVGTRSSTAVAANSLLASGWVYSKGWNKRPRANVIKMSKISSDIAVAAKRVADKRAARPFQMGKHDAAAFGKLPSVERPHPPSYASSNSAKELDRLRYILVDVSRARVPGPRYCLDPVNSKRLPRVNGRVQVQGRSLVTGFSKSISGKMREYPSIDGSSSFFIDEADMHNLKANEEALNSGVMWAGRPTSGSIYETGSNIGGPGPAYEVNNSFLATSRPYTAERPQFSPINSSPEEPFDAPRPQDLPHGRRNPGRLSPELSKAFKKY